MCHHIRRASISNHRIKIQKSEEDSFTGSILGGAIGDAVGEIAQKKDLSSEDLLDSLENYSLFEYTDDTAMAVSVAEALINDGRIETEYLGQRFHTSWIFEPSRGYSDVPPTIFFTVEKRNISYLEASQHVNKAMYGKGGSVDDGAAMRVHPVGLFFDRRKNLAANAELSARLTHQSQITIDSAVVVALAVSLCRRSKKLNKRKFIRKLASVCKSTEMRNAIMRLPLYLKSEADPIEVSLEYGNTTRSSTNADSVIPFALFCDCLRTASCSGGDADTIAAIACSISGSYLGLGSLPEKLISRIENRQYLTLLAIGLYKKKIGLLPEISYREWRSHLPIDKDSTLEEL